MLATVLALGGALGLGAAVGFALRSLWPWVFVEALTGALLGLGLVVAVRAPRVRPRLIAAAAALVVAGFVLGQWVALSRTSPSPVGLGAFVSLKLTSEPVLGDVRAGPLGNLAVLGAQWLLVAASAWMAAAAYGAARGRGTPRAVRAFVAAELARGASESDIRASLAARGWTDARAQTEALIDGARQRASERPC